MLKKSGLKTPVQSIKEVVDSPAGLSGADIEAILARAALISDAGGSEETVSPEVLRHTFADFIPASSPLERELQILVAVQECTSREVLPAAYRNMERAQVQARINELRMLIGA
jgi:hypothetical protein